MTPDPIFGRAVFASAALVLTMTAVPIVWRGAPLADDFANCLAPLDQGLEQYLAASWHRLGMIRLARFAEIIVTTGVCRSLPFGVAILAPLLLTFAVALLVRGLLRDVRTPAPWADIAGACWLLQPLGTEAALWPASLHVPLGLACALVALRLALRGRLLPAALAALGAAVSVEQTILALPLAAWLITPASQRMRAAAAFTVTGAAALTAFVSWSGTDVRLRASMSERAAALVDDPFFYAGFPAVGLGMHSIPLAVAWALPWSAGVLAIGGVAGSAIARRLPAGDGLARGSARRSALAVAALIALANVPVLLGVPHQGSPRVFTPTWLVLSAALGILAPRLRWRRPAVAGAIAGAWAAGAALSMLLSVSVRLASADFTERASRLVAARTEDADVVGICGVRRTVTTLAPRGAFAVHELVYDWGAARALTYYTGRRATFQLAGELWGDRRCPDRSQVDVLIEFDDLLAHRQP